MTQVKICGINDPVAFDTAIEAGADWVGFVFFPPSPRFVTPASAAALSGRVSGGPPRVGLFVEPSLDFIDAVLREIPIDVLQIYGALEKLGPIKRTFGLEIWRAVGVTTSADLPTEALGADRLLIEAKAPAGSSRPGGNAARFDWSMMKGWKPPAPWMLAGGLTPGNVADAIRQTSAEAVDVSSGVESLSGVKDPALIRAFIAAAKVHPQGNGKQSLS